MIFKFFCYLFYLIIFIMVNKIKIQKKKTKMQSITRIKLINKFWQ